LITIGSGLSLVSASMAFQSIRAGTGRLPGANGETPVATQIALQPASTAVAT